MGHPMAGHLARAGHQVTVFNRTAVKARLGARNKSEPRRHAARSGRRRRLVFAFVGNDDDLRS